MYPLHVLWLTVALVPNLQSQPTTAPTSTAASNPAKNSDAPINADAWTMFRGDTSNSGVARTRLPDKLDLRWKFVASTTGDPIESTPTIVAGHVYVGCDDGHLYALDIRTGNLLWKYKAKEAIRASACFKDGMLLFGDDAGTFHAVNAADGTAKWTFEAGESIISSAIPVEKDVVFGSYNGNLYRLKAADGAMVWKYGTEDKLHAAPAIAGENVLISGCDTRLHVVKLSDGSLVRKGNLGAPCGASAAIFGNSAFAGTQGNQVVGLDWTNGEPIWLFEDKEKQLPFLASAAIADGLVVLGGRDKKVRAFDVKTGDVRWTVTTKGRIESSAIIVGERVFLPTGDGTILAMDLRTGAEKWRYEAGGGFVGSPAAAEEYLVIGSVDGIVYCFR